MLSVLTLLLSLVDASDCNITIALWRNFGRVTNENPEDRTGCCKMRGVECIRESVIKINWTDQSLIGSILPSIGNLVELNSLTLSLNAISGEIPEEIGTLENLERLDLGGNQLSGGIPASIGQLRKLTQLSFLNNQLSGSIPKSLANCRELKTLWLGLNKLNGIIPSDLEMLTKLESLNLKDNQFSKKISSCVINGMNSLNSLDMSNNPNLSGAIWPPSNKVTVQVLNTSLTDCSPENVDKSASCAAMRCQRPADGRNIAWWMIVLILIAWILIFGIIGIYLYAEYTKWKLMQNTEEDEKSVTSRDDETECDNESVITKLDGFKHNGEHYHSYNASKYGSKSTSFSFFRRSQYLGADGKFTNKESYIVEQPHTPANDDELELKIGEIVKVLEQFEDGWAFGLNITTDETGVFPLVCLK